MQAALALGGVIVAVMAVGACGGDDDGDNAHDASVTDGAATDASSMVDAIAAADAAPDAPLECPYYVGEPCRTVDQGCFGGQECYWVYLSAVCGPPSRACVDASSSCADPSQTCYVFPPGGDPGGVCLSSLERECFCQATFYTRPTWCD